MDISVPWDTDRHHEAFQEMPNNDLRDSIRILHVCEVLIEKSVPRVAVWHHEAEPCDAKL